MAATGTAESTNLPTATSEPTLTSTDEDAERALLQIYYFAYGERFGASPEDLRSVDVEAAAAVLKADRSPHGSTRRRAAAAVLAGSAKRFGPRRIDWDLPSVGAAIETFQIPLGPFSEALSSVAGTEPGRQERIESQAYTFLHSHPTESGGASTCCACVQAWDVEPANEHTNSPAKVYFLIEVPRSVSDVSKALDPQRWDECSKTPGYFPSVFATTGESCSSPDRSPRLLAPTPGSTWTGRVEETFRFPVAFQGSCPQPKVEFVNFLHIKATTKGQASSPTAYRMTYKLCPGGSESSTIGCTKKKKGIEEDCGWCSVKKASNSNHAIVQCVKFLRYSADNRPTLDPWVATGLRALIDRTRDEALCCHDPGTPIPPPCDCPKVPKELDTKVTCEPPPE